MPHVRDVAFVVPVYNEASVIGDVIAGIMQVTPHVVCVNDGSRDGSAAEGDQEQRRERGDEDELDENHCRPTFRRSVSTAMLTALTLPCPLERE